MLWFENDSLQFDLNRCCQCGTCLAVCKTNALFPVLKQDGLYEIRCNTKRCTKCGKCVASCPARYLPRFQISEEDWGQLKGIFLGQAKDSGVSMAASSGGVARILLKTALDSSFCDTAYCVAATECYPWAEGRYFEREVDLSTIANSMYLPILVNENLKPVQRPTTILVIGTNCQLMGMDLFYRTSNVRLIKVALLCKQQKSFEFTRFIARRLGIGTDLRTPVRYRGNGWPGKVKVGKKELRYEDAAALPYGKKLWMIPGCRFCAHPLGWNVDITLSDPWGICHKDKRGKTVIFVRTATGRDFLDSCKDKLFLKAIDIMSAKKSVDWEGIKRKQRLIAYYLREDVPCARRMVAKMADCQRVLYETILERVPLPRFALRVINRIPFGKNFIL